MGGGNEGRIPAAGGSWNGMDPGWEFLEWWDPVKYCKGGKENSQRNKKKIRRRAFGEGGNGKKMGIRDGSKGWEWGGGKYLG